MLLRTKDKVCQAAVYSILLYDWEAWPARVGYDRTLAVFDNDSTEIAYQH